MSANLPLSDLSETMNALTGKLPYKLTNDYVFRAILQESNQVLKDLSAHCSTYPLKT